MSNTSAFPFYSGILSRRILVADDHESSRKLLVDLLEGEGHEVVAVSDGTAAHAILREQSVDLALLDVMMPGETGFSICREVKNEKATRLIPIVLVTGLTNSADRVLGIEVLWNTKLADVHRTIGERICAPLRSFKTVLPIIRHHHERRNGSGYPDGLKNDSIPLTARILTTVDVYDALTTDRPYRQASSKDAALEIMGEEAKKGWWDSDLIKELAEVAPGGESLCKQSHETEVRSDR